MGLKDDGSRKRKRGDKDGEDRGRARHRNLNHQSNVEGGEGRSGNVTALRGR